MMNLRMSLGPVRALARTAAAAIGLTMVLAGGALAQDTVAQGQKLWADKAGCPFCHGWAADGNGDPHSDGGAPGLRTLELTREQVREVIQCGRPGTGMPYFDRFAYRDDRCYGVTADDLGDQMPNRASVTLQPPQIDAITDYIMAKVVGAGPVSREDCESYFGGPSDLCSRYQPKSAAMPAIETETDRRAAVAGERKPGA